MRFDERYVEGLVEQPGCHFYNIGCDADVGVGKNALIARGMKI
jgi:hypothetical protein